MTTPFRVRHGLVADVSSNTRSAIVANNQVLTGSANTSLVDLATTWNTSGTPTAFRLNVTDTASAAGSLLMDLQVGGASIFAVRKNPSATVPLIAAGSSKTTGISIWDTGARLSFIQGGVEHFQVIGSQISIKSDVILGFSPNVPSSGPDTSLTRRAAASLRLGAADTSASATITVTIASPGVVTWSSHGLTTGTPVVFSTDGALPTGITAGTTYYAIVVNTTTFQLATSFANALAGTAVNTSGSQSGTHTGRRGAIAQTFGVQDTLSTSSLENIDGADFVIRGSRGIGNKPGGSIVFQVAPAGTTGTAQNALATALTIGGDRRLSFPDGTAIINDAPTGASNQIGIWAGGIIGLNRGGGNASQLVLYSSGVSGLVLNSGTSAGAAPFLSFASPTAGTHDTFITRDAANTLALRNGTNAQAFNIYNTFTDASNYERLRIDWASIPGRVTIGPQWAGTGTAKNLYFAVPSGGFIFLQPNGATSFGKDGTGSFWDISSAGHFLASSDNTYDIGASGANRPRNVFVAGTYNSAATIALNNGNMQIVGSASVAYVDANDFVFRNYAGNAAPGVVAFGGKTSSFPAIKRSSATLQVRLADDSAFTNIQGKITTETAYTAGAPTATGYLVLYDSNGTAYKVPAEALA